MNDDIKRAQVAAWRDVMAKKRATMALWDAEFLRAYEAALWGPKRQPQPDDVVMHWDDRPKKVEPDAGG